MERARIGAILHQNIENRNRLQRCVITRPVGHRAVRDFKHQFEQRLVDLLEGFRNLAQLAGDENCTLEPASDGEKKPFCAAIDVLALHAGEDREQLHAIGENHGILEQGSSLSRQTHAHLADEMHHVERKPLAYLVSCLVSLCE